jgi:pyridoxal phosphate-dependent aminotransferase EpsN
MRRRVYLSPPDLGAQERSLLLDAFDSNWVVTTGPHIDAFEREFAAAVGVPHAVAVSSGTAALHLALVALGIGRGDEVITSTMTFAATANVIVYVGATPVFVDVSADSWTLDPDLLDELLERRAQAGRRTAAVIAVDLYGQCANYDRVAAVCEWHGIPLIEDAAEALGATCGDQQAGAFGQCAAFSFNGNKIITAGGGGMLVSHRVDIIDRARHLANQARDPAAHYQHSCIGFNYRLSNLLAAIGRGQLRSLNDKVRRRRAINDRYQRELALLPGIAFMPEADYGRGNCWLTCITVAPDEFGQTREEIRRSLETEDIESRPLWKPMHRQPVFAGCDIYGGAIADDLFEHGLCLPSGSALTPQEQALVIDVITSRSKTTRPRGVAHAAHDRPGA